MMEDESSVLLASIDASDDFSEPEKELLAKVRPYLSSQNDDELVLMLRNLAQRTTERQNFLSNIEDGLKEENNNYKKLFNKIWAWFILPLFWVTLGMI